MKFILILIDEKKKYFVARHSLTSLNVNAFKRKIVKRIKRVEIFI